ncbi:MAG TPA: TetR/AcrR family transcriptional regulator [Planctomycetota bacterium]|nr:TetR/AcrR family transcriptional regulator [Planctomycetota bacterium]
MAKRKSSAEETKERLIEAVIRLMDGRAVADISVKDIAAAAGVNHGLVHRYFGSKEALVREAVVRTNALVSGSAPQVGRATWMLRLLRERPEIARILARCCLDGPRDLLPLAAPPAEVREPYVAGIRRALAALGLGERAPDPYVVNAAGCAAALGWVVFRPLFEQGFGLPPGPDADAQVEAMASFLDGLFQG